MATCTAWQRSSRAWRRRAASALPETARSVLVLLTLLGVVVALEAREDPEHRHHEEREAGVVKHAVLEMPGQHYAREGQHRHHANEDPKAVLPVDDHVPPQLPRRSLERAILATPRSLATITIPAAGSLPAIL